MLTPETAVMHREHQRKPGVSHSNTRGIPPYILGVISCIMRYTSGIDHSQKIISFRLGTYHRTLEIREQTRWTYKLQGERVLCQTAEQMEEALLSSGSKRYGVDLGRKALQD